VINLSDINRLDLHEVVCLFLPELERTVLHGITPQEFSAIQRLASSVSNLIWLAKTDDTKLVNPTEGMITGLLRSIQTEFDEKGFVSISIQEPINSKFIVQSISLVLKDMLSSSSKKTRTRIPANWQSTLHQ